MGKNNQQRRAEKRRQRVRSQSWSGYGRSGYGGNQYGWSPDPPTSGLAPRDLAEMLIFSAAEAAEHGEANDLDAAMGSLDELRASGRSASTAIGAVMTESLVAAVRSAWKGGWQPTDIVRAGTRRLGRQHAALAGQVIAAEARTSAGPGVAVPDAWAAQLQQVGVGTG